MTKKPHAGDGERQRRTIASIAPRTGGLIGTVILGGLLVACGSGEHDVGAALAAPTRAQIKTVAEGHFIFERLDRSVVNQHSAAHDSDLHRVSIAADATTPLPWLIELPPMKK